MKNKKKKNKLRSMVQIRIRKRSKEIFIQCALQCCQWFGGLLLCAIRKFDSDDGGRLTTTTTTTIDDDQWNVPIQTFLLDDTMCTSQPFVCDCVRHLKPNEWTEP